MKKKKEKKKKERKKTYYKVKNFLHFFFSLKFCMTNIKDSTKHRKGLCHHTEKRLQELKKKH